MPDVLARYRRHADACTRRHRGATQRAARLEFISWLDEHVSAFEATDSHGLQRLRTQLALEREVGRPVAARVAASPVGVHQRPAVHGLAGARISGDGTVATDVPGAVRRSAAGRGDGRHPAIFAERGAAMNQPLVSVIMPFLDGEPFIEEAIASVLAQTYAHWELLLVDDGSRDGSTAIAQAYAKRYPGRVDYVEHPGHANRGTSASRNLGISHGRGSYVALIDADDVWLPGKLEQQVALLEAHPEAGMICGASEYWYGWTGSTADAARDKIVPVGAPPDTMFPPPHLLMLLYPLARGAAPCVFVSPDPAACHRGRQRLRGELSWHLPALRRPGLPVQAVSRDPRVRFQPMLGSLSPTRRLVRGRGHQYPI